MNNKHENMKTLGSDSIESGSKRDGRSVRWCWINFQFRGVLLIWIIVGQGPISLAVGAGGVGLDIFLTSIIFSSFFLSLGDSHIWTEILSERAVQPKTTNHPIRQQARASFMQDVRPYLTD